MKFSDLLYSAYQQKNQYAQVLYTSLQKVSRQTFNSTDEEFLALCKVYQITDEVLIQIRGTEYQCIIDRIDSIELPFPA